MQAVVQIHPSQSQGCKQVNRWQYKLDELAERAITKANERGIPVICRCGETPGGTKHIGNFNDNLRSYFIYLIVKEKGYTARHIQTRDNLDPFRKLPSGFYDLKKRWKVSTEELIKSYEKYVGTPLYYIPDPLGCCANYAEHFSKIYEEECREMGLKETEYFSTQNLYKTGRFNPYINKIFKKKGIARDIILNIESSKPRDYFPIWAICENCGKVTGRITTVDLDREEVGYVCTDRYLTPRYKAIGCAYRGTTNWNNGHTKMDWEFEWPAQMLMFQTTIEPFGKEHHIGSWPVSKQVIERVYEKELPIVFFYEYFLIRGQKISTRHGNIITLSQLSEILEPEVIRFLYTKRPQEQRNIDLSHIDRLVDEFDKAEKIHFGLEKAKNEKEKTKLTRSYELAMLGNARKESQKRISYRVAASIVQAYPKKEWVNRAKRFSEVSASTKKRLKLVKNWVDNLASEEFKIKVSPNLPITKQKLGVKQQLMLKEFAQFFLQERTEAEIWAEINELSGRYKLGTKDLFDMLYLVLTGKERGPKLPPFLLTLDREFIVKRLNLRA